MKGTATSVLQYFYLTPASLLVDIVRLALLTRPAGYRILILLQLLEMITKVRARIVVKHSLCWMSRQKGRRLPHSEFLNGTTAVVHKCRWSLLANVRKCCEDSEAAFSGPLLGSKLP